MPAARRGRAVTHLVQPGETLYRISKRYGVSAESLMRANGISDPRELRVGASLVVPGLYERATVGSTELARAGRGRPDYRRFGWPVAGGRLSSGFGLRDGVMHDGVDIASPSGTPVLAADRGEVIFAGRLRGYGNVVIVRHDEHYVTVYGHNRLNEVREGERVARGQVIGLVGSSGRTTGPNLHFEVRRDNVASNPLEFLPPLDPATGTTVAQSGGS